MGGKGDRADGHDNLPPAEIIVILAGKCYCGYLIPYLNERFANVMVPADWFEVNRE